MKRFVLFSLGNKEFALPLERMVRIFQKPVWYRLPKMPLAVSGVTVVSDELVPVLRADFAVGHDVPGNTGESPYCLIVNSECGSVALPVDQVKQIVALDKGVLEDIGAPLNRSQTQVFLYEDSSYIVLDIDYLVLDMLQSSGSQGSRADAARRHQ